jgi:tRNA dimethylallyltransferase
VDPQVRQRLQEEYLRMGLSGIRSRLGDLDPEYLKTVDPFNPKRILKALEISETTGRPYSSFLTGISKPRNFSVVKIGLDMPRMELHQRINARVDHMMVQGLLQEAEGLLDYRHLNALNTVGYKELFAYMEGKCTLERAVETIKGHTRQYARRQLTWFRRYHDIGWFLPDAWDQLIDHIHNKIRE